MKSYTVGIYFSSNLDQIVLIHKNRPEWQKGLWNFPGGKVENSEYFWNCIIREFEEECRVNTDLVDWKLIGEMINTDLQYRVHIFTAIYNSNHGILSQGEDQEVKWFNIDKLPENIITNVSWITLFAKNYWIQGTNEDFINFAKFSYTKEKQ